MQYRTAHAHSRDAGELRQGACLALADDGVCCQLGEVVLHCRPPPLHKVVGGSLALHRVLLWARGYDVASMGLLQQFVQCLGECNRGHKACRLQTGKESNMTYELPEAGKEILN